MYDNDKNPDVYGSTPENPPGEEAKETQEAAPENAANAWQPVGGQTPPQPQYQPYSQSDPYQGGWQPYNPQQPQQPQRQPYSAYNQPPQPVKPKKTKKTGLRIFCGIMAVVLIIAGFAAAIKVSDYLEMKKGGDDSSQSGDPDTGNAGGSAQMEISSTPTAQSDAAAGEKLTSEQVAAKVRPSIVGILVYNSAGSAASEGTGVIMQADKGGKYTYIITCAHVINSANVSIYIQLESGKQYEAKVVGYDDRTDIGVLRVEATGLPAAEFGDSEALVVGSPVYAVGNPGGVEFFGSVTRGIISAIGRSISSESGYTMVCLQHDAAISPGNSGGALVNEYGQVVGINSMKIMGDSYEGMGFAVPSITVKEVVDKLIKHGYVPDRPKLGISYYNVSKSQQYSMIVQLKGLPAGSLIIGAISSDSDLVNTKAKVNDLIIRVNGKDLTEASVLLDIIDNGKVGDTVTLTLCRVSSNYEISEFDIKVKLVEDKGSSAGSSETTTEQGGISPF